MHISRRFNRYFVNGSSVIGTSDLRHAGRMRVDVTTVEGRPLTASAATTPVGTALRIAPAFIATTDDDERGVRTSIEAAYRTSRGEYTLTAVTIRALVDDVPASALRQHTSTRHLMRAAVPACIALQLDEDDNAPWVTVADLTAATGRILPEWLAQAARSRGAGAERMDVVAIVYATAALAGDAPLKAIQAELDVPYRTAQDWVARARAAGRLKGVNFSAGRQAEQ
jgi:hypothetical protein